MILHYIICLLDFLFSSSHSNYAAAADVAIGIDCVYYSCRWIARSKAAPHISQLVPLEPGSTGGLHWMANVSSNAGNAVIVTEAYMQALACTRIWPGDVDDSDNLVSILQLLN